MVEITASAQIIIHRPAAEVFEAFADPEIMTKFWFPRASGRLEAGEEVRWYVGTSDDAFEITVRVKSAEKPSSLHLQWGDGDAFTDVKWEFESKSHNETVVRIRESGFSGDQSAVVVAALNSTGGFNQVIVAAKALVEHGVHINVVNDHIA
ncbi:MAG: SRPBCC domain-containing protein [Hyphomicrobiales bacterium]